MDSLWSEICWSTFKYFIILIVSVYDILCIRWIIKCLIIIDRWCKHEDPHKCKKKYQKWKKKSKNKENILLNDRWSRTEIQHSPLNTTECLPIPHLIVTWYLMSGSIKTSNISNDVLSASIMVEALFKKIQTNMQATTAVLTIAWKFFSLLPGSSNQSATLGSWPTVMSAITPQHCARTFTCSLRSNAQTVCFPANRSLIKSSLFSKPTQFWSPV